MGAELARIVLVGFMGAGKTAVGAALARRLGWRHLDLDAVVERTAGCSVAALFAERGEAAFRAMETEATRAVAGEREVVISTGGGWPMNPAHREMLREGAHVVWLRAPLATLLRRASAQAGTRPLLAGDDAEARAAALYAAREPLYAAADQTVDTEHRSPAQAAGDILQRVRARILPA